MTHAERLRHVSSPEFQERQKLIEQTIGRLLVILCGHVWHTTTPERFSRICSYGFISPEPDIPDSERWSTILGPEYYPYARSIGGVSLFDFDDDFDPETYGECCPNSSWRAFVPCQERHGSAVWIEIDQAKMTHFVSGQELFRRWNDDGHGRKIMPYIEAAHLAPIPKKWFKRSVLVQPDSPVFQDISC